MLRTYDKNRYFPKIFLRLEDQMPSTSLNFWFIPYVRIVKWATILYKKICIFRSALRMLASWKVNISDVGTNLFYFCFNFVMGSRLICFTAMTELDREKNSENDIFLQECFESSSQRNFKIIKIAFISLSLSLTQKHTLSRSLSHTDTLYIYLPLCVCLLLLSLRISLSLLTVQCRLFIIWLLFIEFSHFITLTGPGQ